MDQKLQSVERVRQEAYGALRAQVTTLSERAGSLTNALRTPHVRGRWGEAQLRNVVEYAGMVEYCDYVSQATKSTEDGLLRPDLVVRIPGGKHVVVDAKAPLAAYLDAFETSEESERERHLGDHARQVREHVTKLSAKGYWRQFEPTPDLVVMFLPDESYLRAAHEHDPTLQEYAWSSNVVLASPSTLMILLRTVAVTWQQETLAESAHEVSELGRELYKRLATMGAHVGRLGKSLDGAVKAYNETVGSLERQVLSRLAGSRSTGSRASSCPSCSRSSARPGRWPRRSWSTRPRFRSRSSLRATTPPERDAPTGTSGDVRAFSRLGPRCGATLSRWRCTCERRSRRDHHRWRSGRLHGGPLHRQGQPEPARDRGLQLGRSAHDHERCRELPGIRRRDPRAGDDGRLPPPGRALRRRVRDRRRHARRLLRAPLPGLRRRRRSIARTR